MKYLFVLALASFLSGCSDPIAYVPDEADIAHIEKMLKVVAACESTGLQASVKIETRTRRSAKTGFLETRPHYKVTCEEKTQ